jgi:hypothetical protein
MMNFPPHRCHNFRFCDNRTSMRFDLIVIWLYTRGILVHITIDKDHFRRMNSRETKKKKITSLNLSYSFF